MKRKLAFNRSRQQWFKNHGQEAYRYEIEGFDNVFICIDKAIQILKPTTLK